MSLVTEFIGNVSDTAKNYLDHGAAAGIAASLIGLLPAMAAAASILWYCVRAFDWWERRKLRQILVAQGKIEEALEITANKDA